MICLWIYWLIRHGNDVRAALSTQRWQERQGQRGRWRSAS